MFFGHNGRVHAKKNNYIALRNYYIITVYRFMSWPLCGVEPGPQASAAPVCVYLHSILHVSFDLGLVEEPFSGANNKQCSVKTNDSAETRFMFYESRCS